ncbi:MAG: hypothetical protein KF784_10325 [Fimbriimonadaceae bacterium]|nr:hypothetical protein [Fimbriimonadaceae bacterium]
MISTLLATAFIIAADAAALNGNDPVELCKGHSVAGKADLTYKHGLYTYTFSNQKNLDLFKADPERWGVQIGGACGSMGPLSGRGDGTRFTVYDGRIWLFASLGCKASFERDPANHVDKPDVDLKPTAEEAKAAKAILDKAVEAHGGWQAISGIKSFVWETSSPYKTSDGKDAAHIRTYGMKHPGHFYSGSVWEGGGAWNWGTTSEGRAHDGRDTFNLGGQELGYLQRDLIKQPIMLLRSSRDTTFRAKPVSISSTGYNGTGDAVQVQMLGKTVTMILDPKTHRIIATISRDRASGPYTAVTRAWSNYQKISGVEVPMTITVSYKGMQTDPAPRSYSSVRINDPLDEKLFVKPAGL